MMILYRFLFGNGITQSATIVHGNALRMDWDEVVPKYELSYILGNPPFVGLSLRNAEQQRDMELTFTDNSRAGRLDYVAAWYRKAADYIQNTRIGVAFVSTNSIVQGEQVPILWKDLSDRGIYINFAYRTFTWSNEAKAKAAVHCVIVGFSLHNQTTKRLFEQNEDGEFIEHSVEYINGYLTPARDIFIELRGKARADYPKLIQGNKPWDGGFLILSKSERDELIDKHPVANSFVKLFLGSSEFINGGERYCLWLQDVPPAAYRKIPEIMERLSGVRTTRQNTKTVAVQKQADTPMLFSQIRQPDTRYLAVPEVSSERHRYIPIGFLESDVIASNKLYVIPDATLFIFAMLTSNVHMAWMRMVAGRLKSDYSYSPAVYNNFPWPTATEKQQAEIEKLAQAVLDARANYPTSSLADLYDPLTMPPDLLKAHRVLDSSVQKLHDFPVSKDFTEANCVAALMEMYQEFIGGAT